MANKGRPMSTWQPGKWTAGSQARRANVFVERQIGSLVDRQMRKRNIFPQEMIKSVASIGQDEQPKVQ